MRSFFPVVLAALATFSNAGVIPEKRASVCNGRSELCGRKYGETTFMGAHNSFAYSTDVLNPSRNQEVDVPSQLNLGVRLLQGQGHMYATLHPPVDTPNVSLAKTGNCDSATLILFDGGLVVDYLKKVRTWLDQHPSEVITLIFTNPDNASLKDVWKPAFDNAKISELAYVPSSTPVKASDWPTLGQLIDSGKRVVVFFDAGANDRTVDFMLPEFQMIWESPFSVTDANFPCKVDRTEGPLSTNDHMYMINHSLNVDLFGVIIPDYVKASSTNSLDSITKHANGCAPLAGGKKPNFILLDWVNIGQGKAAVDKLNGF